MEVAQEQPSDCTLKIPIDSARTYEIVRLNRGCMREVGYFTTGAK
jgi:hypothetical protein